MLESPFSNFPRTADYVHVGRTGRQPGDLPAAVQCAALPGIAACAGCSIDSSGMLPVIEQEDLFL